MDWSLFWVSFFHECFEVGSKICILVFPFPVKFALVRFDHIDEVRKRLLFGHGNRFEMSHQAVCQLSFVETRATWNFELLLVTPKSVHLQLVEIDVGMLGVCFARVILRVLPSPLCSHTLNEIFVVITNIDMVCASVFEKLQFPLHNRFLNAFAVTGVPGDPPTSPSIFFEATNLFTGNMILGVVLGTGTQIGHI